MLTDAAVRHVSAHAARADGNTEQESAALLTHSGFLNEICCSLWAHADISHVQGGGTQPLLDAAHEHVMITCLPQMLEQLQVDSR